MTATLIIIALIAFASLLCGVIYAAKKIKYGYQYSDEGMFYGIAFWVLGIVWVVLLATVTHLSLSEQIVSGIVYNNKNNRAFTGNTTFSVRAAVDTYVSEENQSSYCLPPNSPYKEIVNRAAEDKNIKVVVTTEKAIRLAAPWTCIDVVKVTEQK